MQNEKVPENPPAFPRNYDADGHNGMWLRDWFAGQAMQVIAPIMAAKIEGMQSFTGQEVAEAAYRMADALLAARKEDSHAG
ncbi:hypothetical protein CHH26_11285 [Qipengyuania flava]|uniref:hypothetical protein n=1 Tax=Qipengyuania flava TaxID=192812 RepID=UPI000B8BF885|nr:hypothetical protein [Qipengyuania flava]ASP30744.1 hypothetical protein CHH26_11285 [Qipengyuania flava]